MSRSISIKLTWANSMPILIAALENGTAEGRAAARTELLNLARNLDKANEGHNGWTNYETWLVRLWLDNDQGTYADMMENARTFSLDDGSLAASIKEYVERLTEGDEPPASLATDLIRSALAEVNWQEIARSVAEQEADRD